MKPTVTFEDYSKIEIRVGRIVEAIVPEGSNKLIQFTVDFGPTSSETWLEGREKRTIFSGIKEWYSAEELVGVTTIWVTNIPPKKTPFGESQGMLFAVDESYGEARELRPHIVRLPDKIELGSEFH